MEPTLRDGDWLIYSPAAPRLGDVVVAVDPREPSRWLVKRVLDASEGVELASDRPGHERVHVPRSSVLGRVVFRYWPIARFGPVT